MTRRRLLALLLILAAGVGSRADEVADLVERCDRELFSVNVEVGEAATRAQAIVEWGRRHRSPRTECRGLTRLAFAEIRLGRWTEGWKESIKRSRELAESLPTDAIERAEWLLFNGALKAMFFFAYDDGVRDMREAIAIGEVLGDVSFLAKAHLVLCDAIALRYDSFALLESGFRGWKLAEQAGDAELEASALERLIICSVVSLQDAAPYYPRYQELCNQLGHDAWLVPLNDEGITQLKRTVADTRHSVDTPIKGAERWTHVAEQRRLLDSSKMLIFAFGLLRDDWAAAEPYLELMEKAAELLRDGVNSREARLYRAILLAREGDVDGARTAAYDKVQELTDSQQHARLAANYALLARQFAAAGNNEESLRLMDLSEQRHATQAAKLPDVARAKAQQYCDLLRVKSDAAAAAKSHAESISRSRAINTALLATAPVFATLVWMWLRAAHGRSLRRELRQQLAAKTESLELARSRAESADRAKTEYLARINHELRNPLATIVTCCELLDDRASSDTRRFARETMTAATSSLTDVIDDVLDFTRIDTGQLEFKPLVFAPRKLLDTVASITRPQLQGGVVLLVDVAEEVPAFVGTDESKLRQSILNLCSNAARHTTEGRVHLIGEYAPLPDGNGGELTITVEDTGCGINPKLQKRVFERYLTASDRPGIGLGLHISNAFTRCMGGSIECQSTPDVGSVMTIRVPVTIEDEPSPIAPARDSSTQRVLVIDDKKDNVDSLAALLSACEYTTLTATDWDGACDALAEGVDAVLLDLRMPVVDGFTMAERIRSVDDLPSTPRIIAVTGDATEAIRSRAEAAGFDGFLSKPFTREELVGAIAVAAAKPQNAKSDVSTAPA